MRDFAFPPPITEIRPFKMRFVLYYQSVFINRFYRFHSEPRFTTPTSTKRARYTIFILNIWISVLHHIVLITLNPYRKKGTRKISDSKIISYEHKVYIKLSRIPAFFLLLKVDTSIMKHKYIQYTKDVEKSQVKILNRTYEKKILNFKLIFVKKAYKLYFYVYSL